MREGVPINGRVLAELRYLAGMEQIDLANASCVHTPGCKVAPNKISDYEREVVKPSAANLNAILKAIRIALEARGLKLSPAMLRALYRTDTLNASNGSTGKDDEADRRQATRALAVGGAAIALFPREAIERITTHEDRPVDSKLVTAHEDLADTLAELHRTERPSVLLEQVAGQADMLAGLLDRSMSATKRQRLEVITVGAHTQAGLLAFNIGNRPAARRYFAFGYAVAEDSGDDTLHTQALGAISIPHSPILTGGRGGDSSRAIGLRRQAVTHARRADPATHAHAHRWLALELAAVGDEGGFFTSWNVAERLFEGAGQGDGHGFYASYLAVTPEELSGLKGLGLVRIGRADEALDALRASMAAGPRSRVVAAIEVAAARVLQGEPEQACTELARALDLTVEAGYRMGIQRILGVRGRFPATWAGLACVQELDERLRLTHAIS